MSRAVLLAIAVSVGACGSHATPSIAGFTVDSPVTASASGERVLSGQVQVADSAGDSALDLCLTFVDGTGASSTATVPLTPGGATRQKEETIPFTFVLAPEWSPGSYSLRATVKDGNDGHESNALEATLVVQ